VLFMAMFPIFLIRNLYIDLFVLSNLLSSIVLMFQEVWGRSFCRTIEKLVEVVQEYPTEVEHIYSPSCVPLVRCAGCCGDENLECHPTQTTNVTMQLLKIRPSEPDQEYVEMTFVEHQTCECRLKGKNMDIMLKRIIIIHLRKCRCLLLVVKEEKGETKNKRMRQVMNGTILGDTIPSNYQSTALKIHYSFLCLSGARTLAGNCSGDPTACCSVAHYLFPTQRQHQESPPLIY
uniref:Placental growth factor b n=1 Tax=Dicentrarchus labrax TaxID=13489 RepID=A0A8C4E0Z6_DICLA